MKRERPETEEGSSKNDVTTAVDFLLEQDHLEKEARELMPFDPNECTYQQGEIRQMVFACLTCSRQNNNLPIGVCYSCSIQCHASHELIELFSKRSFVCDCGTTRMSKVVAGACKLRLKSDGATTTNHNPSQIPQISLKSGISHQRSWSSSSQSLELPAEDIPGSNSYNQNYHGKFCSCEQIYNPLKEEGTMFQCYFGFECGEDWYHDDCILGYNHGIFDKTKVHEGLNLLDTLPEAGDEAANDVSITNIDDNDDESESMVPHFPALKDFDVFICWKCVLKFPYIFEHLNSDIVLTSLPHFANVKSIDQWEELYDKFKSNTTSIKSKDPEMQPTKKIKLDHIPKSFFFKYGFKLHLQSLKDSTNDNTLKDFLTNNSYLYLPDPIFEPPPDDADDVSSTGSLLDLGTEALLNLPREQAVEGLQAYDKMKNKLRDFFKPFAEQGKVITEDEVRQFFNNIKDKKQ